MSCSLALSLQLGRCKQYYRHANPHLALHQPPNRRGELHLYHAPPQILSYQPLLAHLGRLKVLAYRLGVNLPKVHLARTQHQIILSEFALQAVSVVIPQLITMASYAQAINTLNQA